MEKRLTVSPKKRRPPKKRKLYKTIGVVGTRQRDTEIDFRIVRNAFLDIYEEGDGICSGLCPKGGDRFAVEIAELLVIPKHKILWFPAEWPKHGKAAGFIRNTEVARNSDALIACVSKHRRGGTEDTISKFIRFHGDKNLIIV